MSKYLWFIFCLLGLLIVPRVVIACTCDLPMQGKSVKRQVNDSLANATAVFVGKVLSVESPHDSLDDMITMEVQSVWKGTYAEKLVIFTGRDHSCGFPFEEGGTYLVYASLYNKKYLGTNRCQRTAVHHKDLVDLKYLGKPVTKRRLTQELGSSKKSATIELSKLVTCDAKQPDR